MSPATADGVERREQAIAQRDEQHTMAPRQDSERLGEGSRRSTSTKSVSTTTQGALSLARRERADQRAVVGLDQARLQRTQHVDEARRAGAAAQRGAQNPRTSRSKSEQADAIARPQGGVGERQAGVDGVVELGALVDAARHQAARVDGDQHGVVALVLVSARTTAGRGARWRAQSMRRGSSPGT